MRVIEVIYGSNLATENQAQRGAASVFVRFLFNELSVHVFKVSCVGYVMRVVTLWTSFTAYITRSMVA